MKELLAIATHHTVTIIQAMALLIVIFGTVQAFIRSVQAMFNPSPMSRHFHASYIQYARWLVAGLTFQLAADIIETAISPNWDDIGRLAANSAIRTFVNYFLERDLAEVEKREMEAHRTQARVD